MKTSEGSRAFKAKLKIFLPFYALQLLFVGSAFPQEGESNRPVPLNGRVNIQPSIENQTRIDPTISSHLPLHAGAVRSGLDLADLMIPQNSGDRRPDLAIAGISWGSSNQLQVHVRNDGNSKVPDGVGGLNVIVDEKVVGRFNLSQFPDQSFRDIGGRAILPLPLRLAGQGRRLGVVIDPDDEVAEVNEFQNSFLRTVSPPVIEGPDLVVTEINRRAATGNSLYLIVKNIGNHSSTPNLDILLTLEANGRPLATVPASLPVLQKNGYQAVFPQAPVTVDDGTVVEAQLSVTGSTNDIDNTNNSHFERMGFSTTPYTTLLQNPRIRDHLIWMDLSGDRNYQQWTPNEKMDLFSAIRRIDTDRPPLLQGPPNLILEQYSGSFSRNDAWQMYISNVAQSLWWEVNRPRHIPDRTRSRRRREEPRSWSIFDHPDEDLKLLLDARELYAIDSDSGDYSFAARAAGQLTPWNGRLAYDFLKNMGLLKHTQRATILSLTDWMRAYVKHQSGGDPRQPIRYGYAGMPPVDKILFPLEGQHHITNGCHTTAGLYAALLRSVNIPVEADYTTLIWQDRDGNVSTGAHRQVVFHSIEKTIAHADDVYFEAQPSGGGLVPSERLMIDYKPNAIPFYDPPDKGCINLVSTDGSLEEKCNGYDGQTAYRRARFWWALKAEFLPDEFLKLYGQPAWYLNMFYGVESFDEVLTGYFVQPYFSAPERADIKARVHQKLEHIGGGNYIWGLMRVNQRLEVFKNNKAP